MSSVADYPGFLKDRYFVNVLELGRDYPDWKTLNIDFIDLYKFDNESGNRPLDHPDKELASSCALMQTLTDSTAPEILGYAT